MQRKDYKLEIWLLINNDSLFIALAENVIKGYARAYCAYMLRAPLPSMEIQSVVQVYYHYMVVESM